MGRLCKRPRLLPRALLALFGTALAAHAAAAQGLPCCRKSPELHQLRWQDGSRRLVAFGGKGFTWKEKKGALWGMNAKRKVSFFGDAWAFDVAAESWTLLAGGQDANRPRPRWKPASTSFDDDQALIVFGGCKGTSPKGVMNDLWVLTPQAAGHAAWTEIFTAGPPAARRGHIAVATKSHLVVIGGKGYNKQWKTFTVLTDTWSLPLSAIRQAMRPSGALSLDASLSGKRPSNSQWTRGADFPGTPRWGTTGTKVKGADGRELIACFGGRVKNGKKDYTYFNDLYLYDVVENSWKLVHPGGEGAPQARDHHGATDVAGDLYVFGGRDTFLKTSDAVLGDLWMFSFSANAWRQLAAATPASPSSRYMPGLATTVWKGADAVAVFGGQILPGSTKKSSLNDLWVFPLQEQAWQQLSALDCSAEAVVRPPSEMLADAGEGSETAYLGGIPSQLLLLSGGAAIAAGLASWSWGRWRTASPRRLLAAEADDAGGAAYTSLGE